MPELKIEDVKSELKVLVDTQKEAIEKDKIAKLPEDKRKEVEDKKAETQKKEQEAKALSEAQAKKDIELLTKKPEELNDDEKKRVEILVEEKKAKEESVLTADEKIKRIKEESQKRINEVINEMKQVKDKSSKEFETLQGELKNLKEQNEELSKKVQATIPQKDAIRNQILKAEKERISQYLEEDKNIKDRSQRREMTQDELNEWALEDLVAVQEWLIDRKSRRDNERAQDIQELSQKVQSEALVKKQKEVVERVLSTHKELNDKDSKETKMLLEIMQKDGEKYAGKDNAFELMVEEMDKRLKAPEKSEPTEVELLRKEIEDLKTQIQADKADIGIGSTRQAKRDSVAQSEGEKLLEKTLRDVNAPEASIQSALKKYREQHGK